METGREKRVVGRWSRFDGKIQKLNGLGFP